MDILKFSIAWAKAELVSAKIVWLFSLLVLATASVFLFWGKAIMVKAFVIPLFVAGVFLITVGIGLYSANKPRIAQFEKEALEDERGLLDREIARTTKSEAQFKIVFTVLPTLAILSALLLFFPVSPTWRATSIVLVLMCVFLLLVDSQTAARNTRYRNQLLTLKK
ncbi:hypothetical protein EB1_12740 [Empedobacter brevis NBRC 14943 = ATCC 43319]|uniref:Uncharacterized protein n=1 Tax=Empedobacter brevis NBRC 14943 = ATCC 43319 TaxID=1218108 RepID=A0A511NF74_9FLAO|nr:MULTISPECIES: hypothetical protein [Empedobacter]GEM51484.1 hypothetical protein EB1_12740 [Empedobacter brevis NBRC 14943 = ATCC 43319]